MSLESYSVAYYTVESYIVVCCAVDCYFVACRSVDCYIVCSLLLCGKLPYTSLFHPEESGHTIPVSLLLGFLESSRASCSCFWFLFLFFLFTNSYSGMAGYFHSCYVLFPESLLRSLVGNTCIGVNKFGHFQQHLHSLFQTRARFFFFFQPEKLLLQGEGRRARKERCRMCPCQAEHSFNWNETHLAYIPFESGRYMCHGGQQGGSVSKHTCHQT